MHRKCPPDVLPWRSISRGHVTCRIITETIPPEVGRWTSGQRFVIPFKMYLCRMDTKCQSGQERKKIAGAGQRPTPAIIFLNFYLIIITDLC